MKTIYTPFWHPIESAGFILDWDGVLADTNLDFSGIRTKYFNGEPAPLIEGMAALSEERKKELWQDIYTLEMNGAEQAVPVEKSIEFVEWLNDHNIPWAVVSRNCMDSIRRAAERIDFPLPPKVFSRDNGPVKPDPEALWLAAQEIGVPAEQCVMVGDFVYDLIGARRAGMRAVLVERPRVEWQHWADAIYPTMNDFLKSLNSPAPLVPWEYSSLEKQKGKGWLEKAWKLSVQIPDDMPDICNYCEEVARLGVGTLLCTPSVKFSVQQWRIWPGLAPSFLDIDQVSVIQKTLKQRYPLVTVKEGSEGIRLSESMASIERELEEKIK